MKKNKITITGKIRIWLKEYFNKPSISISNVKNSSINITIDGKEQINE